MEPTIVNNVVNLAELTREDVKVERGHGEVNTHATVASTMRLGKSSAPTSPATERTSPPMALISASTPSRRVASILWEGWLTQFVSSTRFQQYLLADDDLGTFLSEKDGSGFANSLTKEIPSSAPSHEKQSTKVPPYLTSPYASVSSISSTSNRWEHTCDNSDLTGQQATPVRVGEMARDLRETGRHR